jgi:cytoskeletal protein RodZ
MPDSPRGLIMSIMVVLWAVWGLVTILFLILLFARSRITKRETDWIPLTDDAREEKAIEAQKVTETKGHKLDRPITALGWLSVIMLLVVFGYWIYHGLTTPPQIPK